MTRSFRGRSKLYRPTAPRAVYQRGGQPVAVPAGQPGVWTFMGGTNGVEPAGDVVFFAGPFDWAPTTRRVRDGLIYFGYYTCTAFYQWDVNANFITRLTDGPNTGALNAILATHSSELIMVAIGPTFGSDTTFPYDIGSDTWGAARAPMPGGVYPQNYPYAPSFCHDDQFIYAISGQSYIGDPDSDSGGDHLTSYKYDMDADTWSAIAPVSMGWWGAGADVGADGKVYVIGGERDALYPSSFAGVTRVYDPNTDTWDESRADPPVPTGLAPFGGVTFNLTAALPNGKLLFGGGIPYDGNATTVSDSADFWIYDPHIDTFTPTTASDTADPTLLNLGGIITATDGNTVYSADSSWDVFGRFDYFGFP